MSINIGRDLMDLFSSETLGKATGEGWQITLDKNTRGIKPVISLIVGYAGSDGYDGAQIETKEDYEAFQKALKEFAAKLGWTE